MENSNTASKRLDWHDYWLNIARAVALRSTCPRLAVGAVIVLDNKIVTTGYNGSPPGEKHCTEVGCLIVENHCMRTIHAEINALRQLHNHPLSSEMKIYVTHRPCELCREEILDHNILEMIYEHYYGAT